MNIIAQQVLTDSGGVMTVEWVAEGGDVISVRLQSTGGDLGVDAAVTKAKAMMVQVAAFEEGDDREIAGGDETGSPAVESLRSARSARIPALWKNSSTKVSRVRFPRATRLPRPPALFRPDAPIPRRTKARHAAHAHVLFARSPARCQRALGCTPDPACGLTLSTWQLDLPTGDLS